MQIAAGYVDDALCLAVHVWPAATTGEANAAAEDADVEDNLHMAQELVGLMGGRLTLGEPDADGLLAQLWLSPAEQTPVLAVDDNADTLKLYERYLSGSQYHLIGTPDPRQALPLARQFDPAAILIDVMLPDMDGWELLGRLRENPLTADVPLIVCTILPQEQLALALGAAAFIRKPVTRETLLAALDRWTSEASLPSETSSATDSPAPGPR
ncbi:MAG: Stage 0 sporulation protein A [Chloroflexi bacterium ADurb.Bin325]|nr:MAG: Stage 0 sporulation protein A [Chloroflexi bacterium ADurb.Bin325]